MPYLWGYARKSPEGRGTRFTPCLSEDQQQALIEEVISTILDRGQYAGTYCERESAVEVSWRNRPVFQSVLKRMNRGDTLIVANFARLERGGSDEMAALHGYLVKRSLGLISIAEHYDEIPFDAQINGQKRDKDYWARLHQKNFNAFQVATRGFLQAEEAVYKAQQTSIGLQYRKSLGLRHGGALPMGWNWHPTGNTTKVGRPEYKAVPVVDWCRIVVDVYRRREMGEAFCDIGQDLDRRGIRCHCFDRKTWTIKKTSWQFSTIQRAYLDERGKHRDIHGVRMTKDNHVQVTSYVRKSWHRVRHAWEYVKRFLEAGEETYGGIEIPKIKRRAQ